MNNPERRTAPDSDGQRRKTFALSDGKRAPDNNPYRGLSGVRRSVGTKNSGAPDRFVSDAVEVTKETQALTALRSLTLEQLRSIAPELRSLLQLASVATSSK
jgi:hypothetical protein